MGLKQDIVSEIQKYGVELFENLRSFIIEEGTKPYPYDKTTHNSNKQKLINRIEQLCESVYYRSDITSDELWKLMYERVFYSGTKASKATAEIESMQKYGAFKNFRTLSNNDWNFSKHEWDEFTKYWKNEVKNNSSWLLLAKESSNWEKSIKSFFHFTGDKTIQLMTKSGDFEGIRFSALSAKMEKYIKIARFLISKENELSRNKILQVFTGANYNFEKHKFWNIHKKFATLLGDITALHLMMDLGFKTVKPDRVLTYLFAKLGWLDVFPETVSKEEVLKSYLKRNVWEDVIEKSLILGELLEGKYKNPLRQLDIWIVKYGQEPEETFGLTKKLEKDFPINKFYQRIKI